MEMAIKIHEKTPIKVSLPGDKILELFLNGYSVKNNSHYINCFYYGNIEFNFLTNKIINYYIKKEIKTHLRFFSITHDLIPVIDVR